MISGDFLSLQESPRTNECLTNGYEEESGQVGVNNTPRQKDGGLARTLESRSWKHRRNKKSLPVSSAGIGCSNPE
jgi:hypothetical protein